jgi:type I restriction enzyme S subunit
MKYQTYPAYKDSGAEWLGDVPEHWKIASLSKLFNIKAGGDLKTEFFSEIETANHPYPIYTNANDEKAIYGYTSKSNYSANTITVSGRGEVGFATYRDHAYDAIIRLLVLSAIGDSHCKFFTYFINAVIDFRVESSAIGQLSTQQISPYKVTFPAFSEQQKIAQFLDHETAKIDTLIEKQQRLIELLKEKRQAVISHAVTKGLNPNAPMKDSGVEWLGDVPEHWFVVPIKRICEVKDGTHETPQYVDKSELSFPLVTSKDFEGNFICFENAKYISKEDHLEIIKRSNTETGDILMSMIGGNIGKALIVGEDNNFSIKNVALFKTKQNDFLARYILFYLQSGLLDIQISLLSRGGAQGFLSLGDIRNLIFFKIPTAEIHEIVTYLNEHTIKFDELIGRANFAIELMQERRTALISAAVTGKIDVRDWGD